MFRNEKIPNVQETSRTIKLETNNYTLVYDEEAQEINLNEDIYISTRSELLQVKALIDAAVEKGYLLHKEEEE